MKWLYLDEIASAYLETKACFWGDIVKGKSRTSIDGTRL
ncbi:hypothetical protein F542_14780 [Bibersteinia trehalosi USDA-ARS-USMARC-188]|uniref:Uncharacterized protein n=4 Tax=Bibersteinia trehalosi TaxID=47735 RepID=W0R9C4_BIBTR|nr:hypothetical protein WQG_7270 [Bibersteinia trehalosi USDA-ARS-USMARC-192]AHG82194.1 hypothetical protein F542_14780 [Bibersteinia trehalosi USDA-ARS-USMARC-188]AHG84507.1 hypothetical protein F543_16450 [Bibersteinia trehalosi USDA-ARS-USMARC-189]AHG85993.1 hypothetical protein F544_7620 [Bibersteinia trehalosi USDA-ARS-USMARC-190]OAQ15815.1 hypothetical protein F480_02785 [Bibersteinia trehalosi Y31]